ncbi:MAG TPA: hypothetical protein VFZ78_01480 [Flavisolibacter sp.]
MENAATSPFRPRRAEYHVISSRNTLPETQVLTAEELSQYESFDTIYRSLCAMMYNYAPLSGHPGGSISSGRFVTALLYDNMLYDFSDPGRSDADIISYAAGHKALGLYAHWALRNEIMRIAAPSMLPADMRQQLRLEDLLGFRRNPNTDTPLFKTLKVKPLDGHPTPATPFVKLATGASGVGVASSAGLAFAAADTYGERAPVVHIIEGEAGLTPGRVAETLAAVSTASLKNVVMHIDWNQASIDSNAVCREGAQRGDYVQWEPAELMYLHDWNTIYVEDGKDFHQVMAAQQLAAKMGNHQPTAIVYRTVKGWNYGIEGSPSHGAGHALCSAGFYKSILPVLGLSERSIELCRDDQLCRAGSDAAKLEHCFWNALLLVRDVLESHPELTHFFAQKIIGSRARLEREQRTPRVSVPDVSRVYAQAAQANTVPGELELQPGTSTTLRGQLGRVLQYYNKISQGALFTAAADLLGSTSVNQVGKDFGTGFFDAVKRPASRTLSIGGICEDAMAGIMSGISSYGYHIGVCSSYGAFIVPLAHISARLHAIGGQARQSISKDAYNPFIIISAHAGIKTGEDGPTHADPQPLQLIQENFPKGTAITLTPWDPQEMWPLVSAALAQRPAVISPFVTRPNETVPDREALGLAPAADATKGVYLLRRATGYEPDGVVVLQGSEVAYAFVQETLPLLLRNDIDVQVYYIASAELFDLLSPEEQEQAFPTKDRERAMGITGFTLPTMYRWITSKTGRRHTMYPFRKGHFLGSGKADRVVAEAGLDGHSQYQEISKYTTELLREENKITEIIE